MKRKAIIERIIAEQKKTILGLQETTDNYRTAADMDEESTHDTEDYSHISQAKDMQLRYEQMLAEAQRNLAFLQAELEAVHDEIENGTIIETDKNYLFVGIPVPVFKMDGKDVISFSEEAPIFKKIKGKKVEDRVEIGSNSYKILSVS
ncbi:hypothetical protein [Chryseobacterium sp. R2A-55]|uniref:hypothetical protein n=1 Tax=Chryseobacterium sp. R2A-55 TaxID=2744445 RepID=UPI001F1EDEC7|nr:hypothetical protein [Chryseobacterium sp. R2A-55]